MRRPSGILRVAAIALAASGCAASAPSAAKAPPAAPEHAHAGANQIAVSPDGRFVVTADGNGGLRALDARGGDVAEIRAPGPDRAPPSSGRLAFTSDGILVGLAWRPGTPQDLVGLRATTWVAVLVPAAPRSIGLFDKVSGLPEGGLPATDCVLPSGGQVLGLVGSPNLRPDAGADAAALQTLYDGREWTVWEAGTGKVVRRLDEFPVSARPRAVLAAGEGILAIQHHAIVRLDAATGRTLWWSDPFEVGIGAPPSKLAEFLTWALRASSERGTPAAACDVVGLSRGDDRAVVSERRPVSPPGVEGAAPPGFALAVLDTSTGVAVWRRRSGDPDATAWIGPGGRTVLLLESGVARLLDVADGADVTPAGWPGGPLPVRAAAAEPGGDGLWVLLADGRIRRLDPPK